MVRGRIEHSNKGVSYEDVRRRRNWRAGVAHRAAARPQDSPVSDGGAAPQPDAPEAEAEAQKFTRRNWFSSIHLDDAAAATLAALRAPSGIDNVSDDDPVQLSTFMTSKAHAAGGRGLPRLPSVAGNAALGVTWR
jgi:hypothetical protein